MINCCFETNETERVPKFENKTSDVLGCDLVFDDFFFLCPKFENKSYTTTISFDFLHGVGMVSCGIDIPL